MSYPTPQRNPASFLYAHKENNAYVASLFPPGSTFHEYEIKGLFKIESLLQDHKDKIVDARYETRDLRGIPVRSDELRHQFRVVYFKDYPFKDLEADVLSTLDDIESDKRAPEKQSSEKTQTVLSEMDALHPSSFAIRKFTKGFITLRHAIIDMTRDGVSACFILSATDPYIWRVKVIAENADLQQELIEDLLNDYYFDDGEREPTRKQPKLGLVQSTAHGYEIFDVHLNENRVMSPSELKLHFGEKMADLQSHLYSSLSDSVSGLHIFRGEPGTGKTSFLNHLAAELAGEYRLIYLPISAFDLISSPQAISLWSRLSDESHDGKKNILIIEDAEALIQSRSEVSTHQGSMVSTLLNLSDGLLGNVLNLHVIATINTERENIDEALLRPGRLHTYYEFKALEYPQAKQLAEHLGRDLSDESKPYTLAEIYNGSPKKEAHQKAPIGFAV